MDDYFGRIRRRCDQLIEELQITTPFRVDTLIDSAGRARGRPIVPIPIALPPAGPTGVLVTTADRHYIFFQKNTSRIHRENIILHELGHLLCDHRGMNDLNHGRSLSLFPDLDPAMVITMLGRAAYSDEQEREAEFIASVLHTKTAAWSPDSTWAVPSDVADVIERIERVFGTDRTL
ncbi:hypothetical protein NDR87_11230 [Nocardia sp. CDC159]|uniref:IrrE N-terminal-like domain-containing protein n=1 Tax=Nocardia pulmonis TaxID=2951408 RepID=A0A9X2E733_9NOCA|nr:MULTISPECIES: hypothetical protein [Nocardia]MCM6774045.1 hypothetical protein [Nocardia pulmonis]MCM6786932.1 hypothetical protein [Nocardia sp. CDC159]